MSSKRLRIALLVLLGLILVFAGVAYWTGMFIRHFNYSTVYSANIESSPAKDPDTVIEVRGSILSFDVTRDGNTMAIATTKAVMLYDLNTLEKISEIPVDEQVVQVRFSPNGKELALSGLDYKYFGVGPLHVSVWDTASWKLLYEYKSETDAYNGIVAWSPDGEQLAFLIPEAGLSVVNVSTGEISATLSDFINPPLDLSWSPDGSRIIATGDYGAGLRRWRVKTGQWVRLWDTEVQPAQQVKWSPDGKQIASGNYGGTVCVWNVKNNECEGQIRAHSYSVDSLDWSPEGGQFATASGAIRVWDSYTGKNLYTFGFNETRVYKEMHWLDPQTIATLEISYTEQVPATIRLWDIASGETKLAFRGWDDMHSPDYGGVVFALDDVKISGDHTELQTSLLFYDSATSIAGDWGLLLTDSQGRYYPLTNITPADTSSSQTRVYQTVPLPERERFKLQLATGLPSQTLSFTQDFVANPGTFTFDPSRLQVGEAISLDEYVDSNGYTLHLIRAEKVSETELLFEFNTEQWYTGVMLSSPQASGSMAGRLNGDTVSASVFFSEMPDKPVEIQVTRLYYGLYSNWSLEFQVVPSMFVDMPPAESIPGSTSQPEAVFTSQDPIFLEAQALTEKFNSSMPADSTWGHIVSETITENPQPGQVYPPAYLKQEQWTEVDANGWVTRSLTTDLGEKNIILQQSVVVGSQSMNLTTGDFMELPRYPFAMDYLLADLDQALNNGATVAREETTCADGSPCLLITITDQNMIRRVWINTETGQQMKIQSAQQMTDGTEEIQFTQTFRPVEWKTTPPKEVLTLFEKVVFPKP